MVTTNNSSPDTEALMVSPQQYLQMWLADSAAQPRPSTASNSLTDASAIHIQSRMPTLIVPSRRSDSVIVELMRKVGIRMTNSNRTMSYAQAIVELDKGRKGCELATAVLRLLVAQSLPAIINFQAQSAQDVKEYVLLRLAICQASRIHLLPTVGQGMLLIRRFSVAHDEFCLCMSSGYIETIAIVSAATILGQDTTYFLFPRLCPGDVYGVPPTYERDENPAVPSPPFGPWKPSQ